MKPAIRISLGMVAMNTSLLIGADWVLEFFPDPNVPVLEARADLAESLAVQYSSLVSADRLPDMLPAMEAVVKQMPEVLSMNLRRFTGEPMATTTEHAALWKISATTKSTPTQVRIPIFKGENQWAVLEVRFDSLPTSGILGVLKMPFYKLMLVMAVAGFLVYLLYLSRTLRYLDPSSVVPSRVRAALDQLVEGVFILDHNQRIVLVNSSFAKKVDRTSEDMIGLDASDLPWLRDSTAQQSDEYPWSVAIDHGIRQTDERLELQSPTLGICVLTTNVSPIIDGGGKRRGALVSFNDITEIERMNEGLKTTLQNLEASNEEVQNINEELFRLATVDPLTECFNRRAFFEKLEVEFALAMREGLQLSVVMADIDHFKKINDDFGHATGDIVIKDMANTLNESIENTDFVGRYGGEEFCLVLVGSDEEAARRVSDRARSAFEALYKNSDSATAGRQITASFGLSTMKSGAENVTEFIHQADQALYESKNNGRNRVTSWLDKNDSLKKAS